MGAWREVNTVWYRLQLVYCDLCGRIIPRRIWSVEVEGAERAFCDPDCERLYRDYWLVEGAGVRATVPPPEPQ